MEEVDEPEIVEIASAGRTDLLSLNLLSLSLTDADGDPKVHAANKTLLDRKSACNDDFGSTKGRTV